MAEPLKMTMAEKNALQNMLANAARAAAPIFAQQEWKWTNYDDSKQKHVPSEAEIALTLQHLADVVIKEGADNVGTGRFHVGRDDDPDEGEIGITVSLSLGTSYIARYHTEDK